MAVSAASVKAGSAFVEVGTNNNPLYSGLAAAQAKLRSFSASVQSIGSQLVGAGVAGGIPLFLGLSQFADFDQAMARVKAVTAGITQNEFAAMVEEAKRLGLVTAYSAKQAAQGMGVLALAGMRPKQVMQAMAPVLDLTAAAQIDVAQSADIALKVMNNMGYQANELRTVLDVMAAAMTTANTDLVMLGEAFKFIGPIAKSGGVNLTDLTAAIQLLSDAGIQAEMAGTTLRGMILSLTSPSAEAKAELARLGVQVKDEKGNFRGLIAIVTDLERALTGVGTGDKLESLGTIFPARQAAGAAELVSQGGAKLQKYSDALKNSMGTTSRIAATQLDTLKGSVELLTSSVEGLALSAGEVLAPMMRQIGNVAMLVTNGLAKLNEQNPQVVKTFAIVTMTALGLGGALLGLAAAISVVQFAFTPFVVAAGAVTAAMGLATSAVGLYFNRWFFMARQASWLLFIPSVRRWGMEVSDTVSRVTADMGRNIAAATGEVIGTFQSMGQGIYDALATADLKTAASIAFKGIQLAAEQTYQGVFAGFSDFRDELIHRVSRLFNWVYSNFETGLRVVGRAATLNTVDTGVNESILRGRERDRLLQEDRRNQRADTEQGRRDRIDALKAQIAAESERAAQKRDLEEITAWLKTQFENFKQARMPVNKGIPDAYRGLGMVAGAEVAGTFSSAAAGLMGAKSLGEKMVNIGEKQIDQLKGLRKDVKAGGAKFE
jgi:TP901 family phage tail tape measure protein